MDIPFLLGVRKVKTSHSMHKVEKLVAFLIFLIEYYQNLEWICQLNVKNVLFSKHPDCTNKINLLMGFYDNFVAIYNFKNKEIIEKKLG